MDVQRGHCWRCEVQLEQTIHCPDCKMAEYCSSICEHRNRVRHRSRECPLFGTRSCNTCNKKGTMKEVCCEFGKFKTRFSHIVMNAEYKSSSIPYIIKLNVMNWGLWATRWQQTYQSLIIYIVKTLGRFLLFIHREQVLVRTFSRLLTRNEHAQWRTHSKDSFGTLVNHRYHCIQHSIAFCVFAIVPLVPFCPLHILVWNRLLGPRKKPWA